MENGRCWLRPSQLLMAAVALMIMVFITGCRCQSLYVVGAGVQAQWTNPPYSDYYQDWANNRTFHVNDTLYFEYDSTLHNVLMVNTFSELYSCNATVNTSTESSSSGSVEFTLSTKNSFYYFTSSGGGNDDCASGMSFHLSVGSCEIIPVPGPAPSRNSTYYDYYDYYEPECLDHVVPTSTGHVVVNETIAPLNAILIPWVPHTNPNWASSVLPSPVLLNSPLVFNSNDNNTYSVYVVEEDDFDQCSISNANEKLDFGASKLLSEPGAYYFVTGNPSLCRESNMKLQVTVNSISANSRRHVYVALIESVVVSVSVAIGVFGFIVYLYQRRRGKRRNKKHEYVLNGESYERANASQTKRLRDGMLREKNGIKTCKLFTLRELESATSEFSRQNELGSGAFGTVYKGVLKDGQPVAVKRAISQRAADVEQFINEVSILSQVNHCNLVKLLGCCLDLKVPLLVYEFIPNGNLQEHLSKSQQGHRKLDWQHRFNIALQTAEALKYLHSQANPPIVHRDVKAANILLDNAFGAKVADFGISKLVDVGATHVSTAIKGTPGYLDPEYYFNSQLTDKSDVYSYGMVLLELITSKKPIDHSLDSKEQNLAVRLIPVIRNKHVKEIIDPELVEGLSQEDFEMVEAVAEVAVACLVKERVSRPSMTEVVEMLQQIRGSTLQAASFFNRYETPTDGSSKSVHDWILGPLDTTEQLSYLEAGLMQDE